MRAAKHLQRVAHLLLHYSSPGICQSDSLGPDTNDCNRGKARCGAKHTTGLPLVLRRLSSHVSGVQAHGALQLAGIALPHGLPAHLLLLA